MRESPYRIMWLIVLFDLPTATPHDRKAYQQFHKFLEKDGFRMMQYSVYIRSCPSPENAEVHLRRVHAHVPAEGEIRVLELTDKQFERMKIYVGKLIKQPEQKATQLELF